MVGIFGIVASEKIYPFDTRQVAFKKMAEDSNDQDCKTIVCHGKNYSAGISVRNIGENKDLCIKKIEEDFLIAIFGYTKFADDEKFFWPKEIIDRIAKKLKQKESKSLLSLSGSFQCFAYYKGSIFLVGDRFGSKNTYYYDTCNILVFGQTVGKILSSNLTQKEKNLNAAKQVIISNYFLDDSTLAKKIYRFPYATILQKEIHNNAKANLKKYWEMPKREGKITTISEPIVEQFSAIFNNAIREMIELEPDIVIPLSGGLDSRVIAGYFYRQKPIRTLTYNLKDEMALAKEVAEKLNSAQYIISNNDFMSPIYSERLYRLIEGQKIHCVPNQYLYLPLFKKHFMEQQDQRAIIDGVLLDFLFSAPIYRTEIGPYSFKKFFRTYGCNFDVICDYFKLSEEEIIKLMKKIYHRNLRSFENGDHMNKGQLFYVKGRLRRYTNEAVCAKENCCYVFKPGYNYDLVDFAFKLNLKIRSGKLYQNLLSNEFPELRKIRYKDSYGNKQENLKEKIERKYTSFRLKLSSASKGYIQYSTDQNMLYFIEKGKIDEYKEMFLDVNIIEELIDGTMKEKLFNRTKQKYYLLDLFQRLLFIQQFYYRYNF